jgi:hypothetical protein
VTPRRHRPSPLVAVYDLVALAGLNDREWPVPKFVVQSSARRQDLYGEQISFRKSQAALANRLHLPLKTRQTREDSLLLVDISQRSI